MSSIHGIILLLIGLMIFPLYWLQCQWKFSSAEKHFVVWHVLIKRCLMIYGGLFSWFFGAPYLYTLLGTSQWGSLPSGDIYLFRFLTECLVAIVGMNLIGLLANVLLRILAECQDQATRAWLLASGYNYKAGPGQVYDRLTVKAPAPTMQDGGAGGGGRSLNKKAEARLAALAKAETEMKSHQTKTSKDGAKSETDSKQDTRIKRQRGQR